MCYTFFLVFPQLQCNLQIVSTYVKAEWRKSVKPDQLASQKPADLDLHCFQNWIYSGVA